jgi:hypothetical protein
MCTAYITFNSLYGDGVPAVDGVQELQPVVTLLLESTSFLFLCAPQWFPHAHLTDESFQATEPSESGGIGRS